MRNVLSFVPVMSIAAITPLAACSEPLAEEPPGKQPDPVFAFDIESCGTHSAGEGWKNGFFPQQTTPFDSQFVAVPFANNIDAVFGYSNGPADAFTDLAAIVRFNPSGFIDVRKGSIYTADVAVPYRANDHFRVFMEIDFVRRFYDVYLRLPDDSTVDLARGYPFRTEQTGVNRLDNFARIVESPTGSVHTCSLWVEKEGGACAIQEAGTPWMSQPFPRQTGRFDVWFTAMVRGAQFVDTVIGLSSGAPDRFTELGPIVRFGPHGSFDVRNGSVYDVDFPQPYTDNTMWEFLMRVDVTSKTYSVYIQPRGRGDFDLIAKDYAFRTEQSQVASLDHLGHYVAATAGQAFVCNVTIDYGPDFTELPER